ATKPAVIFADGKGKTASLDAIEKQVRAATIVLSIDARGLGEGRRETRETTGDYKNSMTAFLAGKTMPGMRALDILRGVDLLAARPDVDRTHISAWGKGLGAVPALYAAAVDTRIGKVTLEEIVESYRSIVDHRIHQQMWENIVPGVLRYFDLPEVEQSIAPREVKIASTVDPLGRVR